MLKSKTIHLRLVTEKDAAFIVSLRNNSQYNKYLSKSNPSVNDQVNWIKEYKKRENDKKEFYFIIVKNNDETPCGTVRLYDFTDNSFCWGSWILNDNKTKSAAIESALLVYDFGFNHLEFEKCHFDVRKENKIVNSFHQKLGAKIVGESDLDYFYNISPTDIRIHTEKYNKFKVSQ